jgi:hypothetical protein
MLEHYIFDDEQLHITAAMGAVMTAAARGAPYGTKISPTALCDKVRAMV